MLSANVFRRNISDYMRGVTTLETVSYATSPRYVLRQQNIGDAVTQGLELEAKFRLSDLWEAAPRIDVRANASFFRSRVEGGRPDPTTGSTSSPTTPPTSASTTASAACR